VSYQAHGGVVILALPERVEAASILALRSRSERAILTGSRAITIDLRATHHIDTPTLSELGRALHRISLHGPRIAVVGADPRVQWVLDSCDIDGLRLYPTMSSAFAHVRANPTRAGRVSWRNVLRRRHPAMRRSSASETS